MPTRDDGVDSVRYFTNISNSFADLNEFLKNTGVGSSDLANAISDFSGLSPEYRSIIEDERERERNQWQEELTQWRTHLGECTYDRDGGRIYEESWSKSNPYTSNAARWFYTDQELSALRAKIFVSPSTTDAPMSFDDGDILRLTLLLKNYMIFIKSTERFAEAE